MVTANDAFQEKKSVKNKVGERADVLSPTRVVSFLWNKCAVHISHVLNLAIVTRARDGNFRRSTPRCPSPQTPHITSQLEVLRLDHSGLNSRLQNSRGFRQFPRLQPFGLASLCFRSRTKAL